jgi:hypothetical protein
MSDKATLLREADEAFTELRRAIDGLSDEEMRRHGAMTAAFGQIAKGEAPYPAGTYDDFDAWNARFVEQKTGVKTADVLAELDASHREFVGAAAAVPEPHFAPGGAAREPFDGAGPGHYREHAAQIRE